MCLNLQYHPRIDGEDRLSSEPEGLRLVLEILWVHLVDISVEGKGFRHEDIS